MNTSDARLLHQMLMRVAVVVAVVLLAIGGFAAPSVVSAQISNDPDDCSLPGTAINSLQCAGVPADLRATSCFEIAETAFSLRADTVEHLNAEANKLLFNRMFMAADAKFDEAFNEGFDARVDLYVDLLSCPPVPFLGYINDEGNFVPPVLAAVNSLTTEHMPSWEYLSQ